MAQKKYLLKINEKWENIKERIERENVQNFFNVLNEVLKLIMKCNETIKANDKFERLFKWFDFAKKINVDHAFGNFFLTLV